MMDYDLNYETYSYNIATGNGLQGAVAQYAAYLLMICYSNAAIKISLRYYSM